MLDAGVIFEYPQIDCRYQNDTVFPRKVRNMEKMEKAAAFIDKLNELVGRTVCLLIFPIIIAIMIEIVMRYVLRASQLWVPETSMFLFGAMFCLCGAYTYLYDGHVRVDIIYNLLPIKIRTILSILSFIPFIIFCLPIVIEGSRIAYDSLITAERTSSAFAPRLFPIKACIPIGGFLLILQGLSKLLSDIISLKTEVPK